MSDIKHTLFRRKRDNRFVLSYVPKGGTWKRPLQVTAPENVTSEKKAALWAEEELAKIRASGGVHPSRRKSGMQSLRDVHERLMAVREAHPDTKGATIQNNWTHLRTQILGTSTKHKLEPEPIADLPMADVDPAAARAFVRTVRKRCSQNHTRNIFSTARTLWDIAAAEGIIKTPNPFRNELVVAELPKQRNKKGDEPITIPLVAAQALLDAPDDLVPLARRVRYCLAITTGLDDGELAGLTWKALYLGTPYDAPVETPFLRVRQAFALRGRDKRKGAAGIIQGPKTDNRKRDVPLHPAALRALVAWRQGWEQLVCRKPGPGDYVFPNADGGAYRPRSARSLRDDLRALNRARTEAGQVPVLGEAQVAPIEFKATRRTFSSLLKDANVDREDRGKLMGHSGETVTERNYTRHELARLAELIGRIPLRWPSVGTSVATAGNPPQTMPESSTDSPETSGRSAEARIGFEPTYDGFAKDDQLLSAGRGDGGGVANHGMAAPHGNGTVGGNGLATGPLQAAPTDSVAASAGTASIDVGDVRVSTDVAAGEPVSQVVARLALALKQQGVPAEAHMGTLRIRQRGVCGGGT